MARFTLDGTVKNIGRVLVSVKGGKQLNPAMVRDRLGTVNTQKAEMGVLITQHAPTPGMVDAVNHAARSRIRRTGRPFRSCRSSRRPSSWPSSARRSRCVLPPYVHATRAPLADSSTTLW